jgi:cell division topological specificity factor
MNILRFFSRSSSAPVARERLQLLLAHERNALEGRSDLLEALRSEIMQVIGKHVVVDSNDVKVIVDSRAGLAMLEIDIEIRAPSDALVFEAARKVA